MTPPRSSPDRVPLAGIGLVVLLSILWGLNFPSTKLALQEMSVWSFRALCVTVGGVGLLFLGRLGMGHSLALPRADRWPMVVSALFNVTIWQIVTAFGLLVMPAGRAVIIAYTMPLWSILLGRLLLAEPITPLRLLGLVLGLAALAILVGPDLLRLGDAPLGSALMLTAALSWAAGTVAVKRHAWGVPTVMLTGWQIAVGGLPILLIAALVEPMPDLTDIDGRGWLAIAYSAAVPMLVCYYIWYTLVRMLPAAIASISILAIPVVGVYAGAVLLGEPVGLRELAALSLVVAALAAVLVLPTALGRGAERKSA